MLNDILLCRMHFREAKMKPNFANIYGYLINKAGKLVFRNAAPDLKNLKFFENPD